MRRPRIQFDGALHHIYSRGNGKQPIFLSSGDMQEFVRTLAEVCKQYCWICHSFCLMDNHYHLLLETPSCGLAEGMQHLNGCYSTRFNINHCRTGHVMQGRYYSPLVTREGHFMELLRYIALNPVSVGKVKRPEEWRWSSYRMLAGFSQFPEFLSFDRALGILSSNIAKARAEYVDFVLERLPEALKASEKPKTLNALFGSITSKSDRNSAIADAFIFHGYTSSEIAEFLGVTPSTVSRVIVRTQVKDIIDPGPGFRLFDTR